MRNRPNANATSNGSSGGSNRKTGPPPPPTMVSKPKNNTAGEKNQYRIVLNNAVRVRVTSLMVILLLAMLGYAKFYHGSSERQSSSSSSSLGRYPTWEAAPASKDEFDHDNEKSVCRLPILSVEEWEAGKYWEREVPVIVKNVTDGWMALEHWTK
jgi:hypothetical protein